MTGADPSAVRLDNRRVLLIVSGGIAAYKTLELIRLLTVAGCAVRCVLTEAGARFVTPLSLQALSGNPVHTTLWSLTDESEMGHIALSRSADLLVVCPASADMLARMAAGLASDLATTLLLATDTPVLAAPAMNVRMWLHPATQNNVATLRARGIGFVGPDEGVMACNEVGPGRLSEPPVILRAIADALQTAGSSQADPGIATDPRVAAATVVPAPIAAPAAASVPPPGDDARRSRSGTVPTGAMHAPADDGSSRDGLVDHSLAGCHALVTAGPTHEPIDPVRFIANRSSGRQGYAIATALAARGARVTLVSGPTALPAPPGVVRIEIETAAEMLDACHATLPVDIAVLTAAVADWRVEQPAPGKLKKRPGEPPPPLALVLNRDILAVLSAPGPHRPRLVIGFAAETEDLLAHAAAKLERKGCDWIVANDVGDGTGVMGGEHNEVHLLTRSGVESWPRLSKQDVADRLAGQIAAALGGVRVTCPVGAV